MGLITQQPPTKNPGKAPPALRAGEVAPCPRGQPPPLSTRWEGWPRAPDQQPCSLNNASLVSPQATPRVPQKQESVKNSAEGCKNQPEGRGVGQRTAASPGGSGVACAFTFEPQHQCGGASQATHQETWAHPSSSYTTPLCSTAHRPNGKVEGSGQRPVPSQPTAITEGGKDTRGRGYVAWVRSRRTCPV